MKIFVRIIFLSFIPVKSSLVYLNQEISIRERFDSITFERQYHKLMIATRMNIDLYSNLK
jgi:hypothetical protein